MPKQPMAEVFGYPIDDISQEAVRHRATKLCPYNNKVPNCTKDKAENPLGVCSVFEGGGIAITCPIRFRQDWIIADDAAAFFFPAGTKWTSLTEIRLADKHGRSAGNIDIVLVSYDEAGHITDFGALEVQAVYISGNIRRPFDYYMADPVAHANMDWTKQRLYPRPDYASSSRKRLAPQLIYKGGILHAWNKRLAVAVDGHFFATLPHMEEVDVWDAELAWLIYELQHDASQNRYRQVHVRTVYTRFKQALDRITIAEPGEVSDFMDLLQGKLEEKLDNGGEGAAPDAPTLAEEILGGDVSEDG
jgi:hypothetical protein